MPKCSQSMPINLIHVIYLTARGGDDLICSICKEFLNTTLQRDNDDDHDDGADDDDQDRVPDVDIDGRRPVLQMMMMSSNKAQSKTIFKSDHVDMSYDGDDSDDVYRKATIMESMCSQLKIDETNQTGVVKQDDVSHSDAVVTDMDDDSDDLIDRCAICGLSTEEADKLHFDTGDYYYYYFYYYHHSHYHHKHQLHCLYYHHLRLQY